MVIEERRVKWALDGDFEYRAYEYRPSVDGHTAYRDSDFDRALRIAKSAERESKLRRDLEACRKRLRETTWDLERLNWNINRHISDMRFSMQAAAGGWVAAGYHPSQPHSSAV